MQPRSLSEAAERVERALSAKGEVSGHGDLLEDLRQQMDLVLAGVDQLLDEDLTQEMVLPQETGSEAVPEMLEEMDGYLRTRNFKATALALRLGVILTGTEVAPLATRLEERLAKFDFAGARSALAELTTAVGSEAGATNSTTEE